MIKHWFAFGWLAAKKAPLACPFTGPALKRVAQDGVALSLSLKMQTALNKILYCSKEVTAVYI
jgi:hypothetical protein